MTNWQSRARQDEVALHANVTHYASLYNYRGGIYYWREPSKWRKAYRRMVAALTQVVTP